MKYITKQSLNLKKIAYIINHVDFFDSHISPIAIKAKKNFKVKLFCGQSASIEMKKYSLKSLKKKKISFVQKNFSSSNINFIKEFFNLISLVYSVKKYDPDIIHCATPKGILLGGLVSFFLKTKSLVIFNSGMGFLFSNKLSFTQILAKKTYFFCLRYLIFRHPNKKIIVENIYDYKFLKKFFSLDYREILLLKGSGVNLNKFKKINISKNKTVLLPSRVLKEKGVSEFVIASQKLKKKYPKWKFIVAGALDYKKQSGYTKDDLILLKKNKFVQFLGFVEDMYKLYKKTAIICLPSYREGLSRSLQEAAAVGIPVVTTNVIGCKDAIIPNKTGLLCHPKNSKSLEKQIAYLIKSEKLRNKFSKNARIFAVKNFDVNKITYQNIKTYKYLINNEKKTNFY